VRQWSATPDRRVCTSPPPRSSALTVSPVAAFNQLADRREIVPWLRTMIVSCSLRHVGPRRGARPYTTGSGRCPVPTASPVVEDPPEVVRDPETPRPGFGRLAPPESTRYSTAVGFPGDVLRAQVLLYRDREVGGALDRGASLHTTTHRAADAPRFR